ncbi:hypothetical protein Goarm_009530 [Gossypium armourianum]|uniref:Uncharacterized protein n=1 Tax=Gossypium armourianum TaxID=34283 RepID=A0A7J9JT94_9ROSI|nr:hypothetical protein [Gossypium armourianum]
MGLCRFCKLIWMVVRSYLSLMESLSMVVDLVVPPSMLSKAKPTGLGYQMLDCKILSISASKTTG